MRRLIYVPIIHTEIDMGTLGQQLRDEYLKRYGQEKWKEHKRFVETMWKDIEARLEALGLAYQKVKVYQDGLPCCGKELELVKEVARGGSLNYQLLLRLVEKGSQVMGTEDPLILQEEYRSIITGSKENVQERLNKRDTFIAQRIQATLLEGETGILFMGLMHRVDEKLPRDIQVEFLLHHLPFRQTTHTQ
jgi:hypothetical protein